MQGNTKEGFLPYASPQPQRAEWMYLDDKANPTILLNFGSLIPTLIFCNQDIALWQNSATSDSLGAEPDHLTMPVLEQISSDHRSPSRVYKRSSNNSHKKFLSVAQKLLFAELEHSQITKFKTLYQKHRNCRTYFILILLHAKHTLSSTQLRNFAHNLQLALCRKIKSYQHQLARNTDLSFAKYRKEEISDLQYATVSLHVCMAGCFETALETLYKRDKDQILKSKNFTSAVEFVRQLCIDNKWHNEPVILNLHRCTSCSPALLNGQPVQMKNIVKVNIIKCRNE